MGADPLEQGGIRYSPEVLAATARELAERLGYEDATDIAYGISMRPGLSAPGRMPAETYKALIRNTHVALAVLVPAEPARSRPTRRTIEREPGGSTPVVSQMVEINFDAEGRLILFKGVPYQEIARSRLKAVDWTPLFEAAGLDLSEWTPAPPRWVPLAADDQQSAWTGSYRHAHRLFRYRLTLPHSTANRKHRDLPAGPVVFGPLTSSTPSQRSSSVG